MGKLPSLHGMGLIPVKPPTPSPVKENGTVGGLHGRGKAMTKHAGQMDARIAAAFTDSATSDDVGGLLAEVEAAVNPSSATPSSGASLRTRAEVIAGYGKGEGDLKVLLYAFLTLIPVLAYERPLSAVGRADDARPIARFAKCGRTAELTRP
jgi:hypothetical protein